MTKRILVSNDDGINNSALWDLVRAIGDIAEVVVSAPDRNCSGVGTAMTLHNPLRANEVVSRVPGVRAYAVQGMPGDSVILGLRELAGGPVDAVVTGINPGNNVTTNMLVSGTLGAAYAGHLNGIPAMAVSVGQAVDTGDPVLQSTINAAVRTLLEHDGDALVNLNYPWAQDWPLKGVRFTRPAPRFLTDVVRKDQVAGEELYWISRELSEGASIDRLPADSDVAALHAGYVSINSMAWPIDEARDAGLIDRISKSIEAAIPDLA